MRPLSLRTAASAATALLGLSLLGLAVAPVALADAGASQVPNAAGDWGITTSANGATIATDTDVTITVACPQAGCDDTNGPVTMTVVDPRGADAPCASFPLQLTANNGQLVSDKLALAHPYAGTCGALANSPGYNGTWNVTVKDTTGPLSTGTFVVKASPSAPVAPTAAAAPSGYTLTWTPNPEADTYAYAVDIDGNYSGTSAKCAFGAASCTVNLTVPAGPHALSLVAARHTSPGTDEFITGPQSLATNVTVAAPSTAASPTAHPTTSGRPTATATPGGSSGRPGSLNIPSNTSLGLGGDFFQGNNPVGSLPSLGSRPKVTASASSSLSAYQQYLLDEGPDGTYKSNLPYGSVNTETTQRIAESTPTGAFGGIASALGVSPVTAAASVGGGILALLVALHLALWTRRTTLS